MLIQDSMNLENACNALETLAKKQARPSPELGAIELAAHALLFITAPKPPEGSEHVRIEGVPPRTVMKEWSSQGHLLDAYLVPWKEELARHATDEQRAFLRYIEQSESLELADSTDAHDIESRPFADILPEPEYALHTLETLAQRYPSDSLNRIHADFATQTMRYIVEHNHHADFCKYLDLAGKRHTPAGE